MTGLTIPFNVISFFICAGTVEMVTITTMAAIPQTSVVLRSTNMEEMKFHTASGI